MPFEPAPNRFLPFPTHRFHGRCVLAGTLFGLAALLLGAAGHALAAYAIELLAAVVRERPAPTYDAYAIAGGLLLIGYTPALVLGGWVSAWAVPRLWRNPHQHGVLAFFGSFLGAVYLLLQLPTPANLT